MKRKKENISIRELFREKLGNAEIIPDLSVRSDLMRKVARKEFLRFNPARINIYYLGGILLAGIFAAYILISDRSENKDSKSPFPSKELNQITDTDKLSFPVEPHPFLTEKDSGTIPAKQYPEKKVNKDTVKPSGITVEKPLAKNKNVIKPPDVGDSFSEKGFFQLKNR